MSVSVTVDAADIDRAIALIGRLEEPDTVELMSSIGAIGESQTRRRIESEKTAPDGTPWAPNRRGADILMETGRHLLQSVAWTASSDQAEWGAAWEHAHVHQFGATIVPKNAAALAIPGLGGGEDVIYVAKVVVPARPFVGISDDNAAEITDLVTDFFAELLK